MSTAAREHPDYYETHSLQVATYLVAKHGVMPRVGGERRRAVFYFLDPDGQLMWDAAYLYPTDEPIGVKSLFEAMYQLRLALDEVLGTEFKRPKH